MSSTQETFDFNYHLLC